MSHFFANRVLCDQNGGMFVLDADRTTFVGRHYETGTVANLLTCLGAKSPIDGGPISEALAFGASGGIAFGYFVFEYKGFLPHVALLARNTFDPFERCLDGLGVVRELRSSTDSDRAEKLLREELDSGNPVVVWADIFSLPHTGLASSKMMWAMTPLLIVGYEDDLFWAVDSGPKPFAIEAKVLKSARELVKKDRNRFMVVSRLDESLLRAGIRRGIEGMLSLYLDKPPAGSVKNFGKAGLAHFEDMVANDAVKDGWGKKFEAGPKFYQAVAGKIGQPGVFDWIETWGTGSGADRGTYAAFLEEAVALLALPKLAEFADGLRESANLWTKLAEVALPDDVSHFAELKALKRESYRRKLAGEDRTEVQAQLRTMPQVAAEGQVVDAARCRAIRLDMAAVLRQIQAVEIPVVEGMRTYLEATPAFGES